MKTRAVLTKYYKPLALTVYLDKCCIMDAARTPRCSLDFQGLAPVFNLKELPIALR